MSAFNLKQTLRNRDKRSRSTSERAPVATLVDAGVGRPRIAMRLTSPQILSVGLQSNFLMRLSQISKTDDITKVCRVWQFGEKLLEIQIRLGAPERSLTSDFRFRRPKVRSIRVCFEGRGKKSTFRQKRRYPS